jgi:hypothetical protein
LQAKLLLLLLLPQAGQSTGEYTVLQLLQQSARRQ